MQNCLSLFPPQKRKSTPKQPCFLRLLVFLWVQVELSFKGPFRHFFWGGCMSSWLLITSSLHTRSPVKKTPSKLTALRNKGLIASLRETQRLSPDHKAGYFYLVGFSPTHLKKIFVKKMGFIFPKFRRENFEFFGAYEVPPPSTPPPSGLPQLMFSPGTTASLTVPCRNKLESFSSSILHV